MWRSVEPTTSMSTARKQRCTDVRRGPGGAAWPRKNGLKGCMPAVVSSTDWSSAEGTSEADGVARWPRSTKKSVNERRISSDVLTEPMRGRFYEAAWFCGRARSNRLNAFQIPLSCPRVRLPMKEA